VIGRSFGLPLLELLLPRARLLPTLSALTWLQLLVEERRGPAPEYRFRHGLVQEAAYGTLVEARRRELHLRVGEALVELHRDSPVEVYGLLGHHFAEADEPERAVEYLMKAGDAARAAYAEEEAIDLYRRALVFMERTGDEALARRTLLRIALTHHVSSYERCRANGRRTLDTAGRRDHSPRASRRMPGFTQTAEGARCSGVCARGFTGVSMRCAACGWCGGSSCTTRTRASARQPIRPGMLVYTPTVNV
jgi:predicted ATPase